MKRRITLSIVSAIALLGTLSCSSKVKNECDDLQNPKCRQFKAVTEQAVADNLPPTPGTTPTFSHVSGTGMTVSWGVGADDHTAVPNLSYKLVYSATDNISTLEDATANGTLAMDWTENVLTADISGLTAITTYFWNVIVKDELDAQAIFVRASQATSDGATATVTATAGEFITIDPATAQTVAVGDTTAFTVTTDADHTVSETVGGTCVAGTWSGSVYTTGAVDADCTVTFSAVAVNTTGPFTVTASGAHVTIDPADAQTVESGSTKTYTVTPETGYDLNTTTVTGTCPAGSWGGPDFTAAPTYTTGAVTGNCTVIFGTTIRSYTVTASMVTAWVDRGDRPSTPPTVAPATRQVNHGSTTTFTVTDTSGGFFTVSKPNTVPNDCGLGAGVWSGNTYTTAVVTHDCAFTFSYTEPTL